MKIKYIECPSCGAKLETNAFEKTIICEYCNTPYQVNASAADVANESIHRTGKFVGENKNKILLVLLVPIGIFITFSIFAFIIFISILGKF